MTYYHDLITKQSWEELQRLQKNIDFVLIGGWAIYLYTKALKSKAVACRKNQNRIINMAC